MAILFFLFGLFVFVMLVVVHEYGHFLAAKKGGVEVEEFGIGFPPKAVGKTMGKGIFRSYYTLNWLPLGGFVKLKGENSEDTRPGSFGAASYGRKVFIMTAGVLMNVLAAILLFSIVAATRVPTAIEDQYITPGSTTLQESVITLENIAEEGPAAEAGLQDGDRIISVNGDTFKTAIPIINLYSEKRGEVIDITFERNGETLATSLELNGESVENVGYSGAFVFQEQLEENRAPFYTAPIGGIVLTAQFGVETLSLLGDMVGSLFAGDVETATQGISGPVGIFYIFSQIDSVSFMLFIGGLISISLAIMNILPIPALDGGRLAVTSIFKALNKPLTEDLENKIHGSGMVFLLILVALITVVDVQNFFL